MVMLLRISAVIILFSQAVSLSANEFYQVTFQLSPTLETLNMRNKNLRGIFGYKLSYNFGVDFKYFLDPDLSLSTGILFHNKGFRNVLDDNNGPVSDDPFNKSVVVVSAHYISVPLMINYHIRTSRRTRILFTAGLSNGILVNQVLEGKRIQEGQETNLMGQEVTDDRRQLQLFKKHFLGLNAGLGFVKYIKAKAVLEIVPTYHRQLNRAIDPEANVSAGNEIIAPKFDSFSLDIRVGYFFNRQIQKKKESF